jgi:predicted translin family RNA/ssDNA-binding protein
VRACLEELAEAQLLAAWLSRPGALLHCSEAELGFAASEAEYLGALADLTGEVGRYAVARATARDAAAVGVALQTALAVHAAALRLGPAWPRALERKLGALGTAATKMEQLLYDHSLVQRAGRRVAAPEWGSAGGGEAEADEQEPAE